MTEQKLKPETLTFNNNVCEHRDYLAAKESIQYLHKHQNQAKGMVICGDFGTGKTLLCKQYRAEFSQPAPGELGLRTILYVEYQSATKSGGLFGAILKELNDPRPHAGSVEKRSFRVLRLLKRLNIELIMIDEIQRALPSQAREHSFDIQEQIKWLMNEVLIPIVLVGNTEAISLYQNNAALQSRMLPLVLLERFTCIDDDAQFDFADYLDAQLSVLPRKVHAQFRCVEINAEGNITLTENINGLLRLCLATQGIPRYINALLEAVIEISSEDDLISSELFAAAWEKSVESSYPTLFHYENPFSCKMEKVKQSLRQLKLL